LLFPAPCILDLSRVPMNHEAASRADHPSLVSRVAL
jgi:hypothetical protein